jgi:hypothetical protein
MTPESNWYLPQDASFPAFGAGAAAPPKFHAAGAGSGASGMAAGSMCGAWGAW